MIRLPHDLHARLISNGLERNHDHVPLLKLYNPMSTATWLATELGADGDTLFGLLDLGSGSPKLAAFSLSKLGSVRLPFDVSIQRDILFKGRFGLYVYAEAACVHGGITEIEHQLRAAEKRLRKVGDS